MNKYMILGGGGSFAIHTALDNHWQGLFESSLQCQILRFSLGLILK